MIVRHGKRLFKRPCRHCGSDFQPTWSGSRYCGTRCQIMSRVSVSASGCFEWTGSILPVGGYGCVRINGRTCRAHIVSWEIHNNTKVPAGLFVLHECDNPKCVNPKHLRVGTAKQNMEDASKRGRLPRGEKSVRAKLTERNVIEIRKRLASGEIRRTIAADFGVGIGAIDEIAWGNNWAWLK